MKPQELTREQQQAVGRLRVLAARMRALRKRRDEASAEFGVCLAAAVAAGVRRYRLSKEVGWSFQEVSRRSAAAEKPQPPEAGRGLRSNRKEGPAWKQAAR